MSNPPILRHKYCHKIELLNTVIAKANVLEMIVANANVIVPIVTKLLSLEGRPTELEASSHLNPSGNADIDKLSERLESLVSRVETLKKLPGDVAESHKVIGETLDALTDDAKEVIQSLRKEVHTVEEKVEELSNKSGMGGI